MPRHGWLTFALLLTLAVEICIAARSPAIALDGVTFIEMARELRRAPLEVMRTQDQHPGFPAMIAGAHAVLAVGLPSDSSRESSESWILAGMFVAIACGLGCVGLVWLVAQRMYNRFVADVAALLAAGLPVLRQNAADVLSDTPHLCAYLLAVWCLQEAFARASRTWYLAAGLASGWAFWIRPEGLSVAIVGGMLLSLAFVSGRLPRRQTAINGLALVCGAALLCAPYVFLTGKLTSKKDPLATVQKPVAFEMPFVDTAPTTANSSGPLPEVAPAIAVTPAPSGDWSNRLTGALKKYIVELCYGFGYVVWIPWVIGHFAPGRLPPLRSSLLLLGSLGLLHSMLLIWLALMAGYLGHRHVMPIIVVALPAAAAGIELLGRLAGKLAKRPQWAPHLAYATSMMLVAIAIPFNTRPNNSVAAPVVEASAWVRTASTAGQTLLANSRYSHFYAELDGPILGIDAVDLGGTLRDQRPDFVLLDVDSRAFAPPEAVSLGAEYRPAFETRGDGDRSWHRVVVFRRVTLRRGDSGIRSAGEPGLR